MVHYLKYKAWHELSDGRVLRVEYDSAYTPATFYDPAESDDGEPRYYIDGGEVDRDDLPEEVTEALIDHMLENAEEFPQEDDRDFDPRDNY